MNRLLNKKSTKPLVTHALDLRNHGNSFHAKQHTYHDMTNDLLDYMNVENISKATLIGHSMGGKSAIHFALSHPDRVEDLIVFDVAPVNYTHNHDDRFEAMKSVPLDKITSKNEAASYLAKKISCSCRTKLFIKKFDGR